MQADIRIQLKQLDKGCLRQQNHIILFCEPGGQKGN